MRRVATGAVVAFLAFLAMSFVKADSPNATGNLRWEGTTLTVSESLRGAATAWDVPNLHFVFTNGPADIEWVKGATDSHVGGIAHKSMDRGYITSCDIVVPGTPKGIMTILVHEFGHCLGMRHDFSGDSIMEMVVTNHTEPTEHDHEILGQIYG